MKPSNLSSIKNKFEKNRAYYYGDDISTSPVRLKKLLPPSRNQNFTNVSNVSTNDNENILLYSGVDTKLNYNFTLMDQNNQQANFPKMFHIKASILNNKFETLSEDFGAIEKSQTKDGFFCLIVKYKLICLLGIIEFTRIKVFGHLYRTYYLKISSENITYENTLNSSDTEILQKYENYQNKSYFILIPIEFMVCPKWLVQAESKETYS